MIFQNDRKHKKRKEIFIQDCFAFTGIERKIIKLELDRNRLFVIL